MAYRDCGLPSREIGSRVGRNQTTVMRICDRWMQEVSARTIRRRLKQSGLSARRPLLGLPLTQNHRRLRRQCGIRRVWERNLYSIGIKILTKSDTKIQTISISIELTVILPGFPFESNQVNVRAGRIRRLRNDLKSDHLMLNNITDSICPIVHFIIVNIKKGKMFLNHLDFPSVHCSLRCRRFAPEESFTMESLHADDRAITADECFE
ncbi:transposable element Tcb1 transposase [Trichonephila clavipes]|nr:transposable element Tcb1 transposase [Trichonephila clavipes]